MTTEASSVVPAARTRPKLAAVKLDTPDLALLRECFGQREVETIPVPPESFAQRLGIQKFEAVALLLNEGAEDLLRALRASPQNKHAIVYGIAKSFEGAEPFLKFSLNSLLITPLDRPAVLETVAATHRLLVRELRVYSRVHLVTIVDVAYEDQKERSTSYEVSGGGMSLNTKLQIPVGAKVDCTFGLPGGPRVTLSSVVSWVQPGRIGVRFDKSGGRDAVRDWLYGYLEDM